MTGAAPNLDLLAVNVQPCAPLLVHAATFNTARNAGARCRCIVNDWVTAGCCYSIESQGLPAFCVAGGDKLSATVARAGMPGAAYACGARFCVAATGAGWGVIRRCLGRTCTASKHQSQGQYAHRKPDGEPVRAAQACQTCADRQHLRSLPAYLGSKDGSWHCCGASSAQLSSKFIAGMHGLLVHPLVKTAACCWQGPSILHLWDILLQSIRSAAPSGDVHLAPVGRPAAQEGLGCGWLEVQWQAQLWMASWDLWLQGALPADLQMA